MILTPDTFDSLKSKTNRVLILTKITAIESEQVAESLLQYVQNSDQLSAYISDCCVEVIQAFTNGIQKNNKIKFLSLGNIDALGLKILLSNLKSSSIKTILFRNISSDAVEQALELIKGNKNIVGLGVETAQVAEIVLKNMQSLSGQITSLPISNLGQIIEVFEKYKNNLSSLQSVIINSQVTEEILTRFIKTVPITVLSSPIPDITEMLARIAQTTTVVSSTQPIPSTAAVAAPPSTQTMPPNRINADTPLAATIHLPAPSAILTTVSPDLSLPQGKINPPTLAQEFSGTIVAPTTNSEKINLTGGTKPQKTTIQVPPRISFNDRKTGTPSAIHTTIEKTTNVTSTEKKDSPDPKKPLNTTQEEKKQKSEVMEVTSSETAFPLAPMTPLQISESFDVKEILSSSDFLQRSRKLMLIAEKNSLVRKTKIAASQGNGYTVIKTKLQAAQWQSNNKNLVDFSEEPETIPGEEPSIDNKKQKVSHKETENQEHQMLVALSQEIATLKKDYQSLTNNNARLFSNISQSIQRITLVVSPSESPEHNNKITTSTSFT